MGADTEVVKLDGSSCGFEGVEKRLEVGFAAKGGTVIKGGLRSLSRCQLDEMLTAAGCTIVSELHNEWFDAYVLSESSLFVYPHRIVVKTCGRTQLLTSIPLLLSYAAGLSLDVSRCKYSRGTFIFPHAQPFPYTSFAEETRFLDKFFGKLGAGSKSHVLDGHPSGSRSWHIYTAAAEAETSDTTYTLEMCMTELDSAVAAHFLNDSGTKSGSDMTEQSGIALLLPSAHICDFAFTPCGYSMNGMEEGALSTIHITPEESHSYASFEAMGYDPHLLDLQALVNRVVSCFKPGSLVMSVHVCGYGEGKLARPSSWSTSYVVPLGYACNSSIRQELPGHSVVTYHKFRSSPCSKSTVTPQPLIYHNWVKPNTPFYSSIQPTVHDDQGLMTLLQQEGNMFQLEDSMIGISPNGANDAAFYTCFHELTTRQASNVASYTCPYEFTRKASDLALYRGSYEDLIAHDQLTSSYELISHAGTLLTLIDSEMDLFQLQMSYPNAKIMLRLRPCNASPLELSPNADVLLRACKKLGLQVRMAVDLASECMSLYLYIGIIRASSKIFDTAKSLGLPPLRLLALGQVLLSDVNDATATTVNLAVEKYFPAVLGVEVIAKTRACNGGESLA